MSLRPKRVTPTSRRPKRVFICHRKEDHPTAFALWTLCTERYALRGDGSVFLDTEGIVPGDKFPEKLNRPVRECDVFFALIGPSWKDEIRRLAIEKIDYVRIEIAQALSERKLVVPVLIGGADRPEEDEIHWEVRPLLHGCHVGALPPHYKKADILALLRSVEEKFDSEEFQKQEMERLDKIPPAPGLAHGYFLNFISETLERIAKKDPDDPKCFLNTVEFIDKKLNKTFDLGKQIESRQAIRLNIILPPKAEYFQEKQLKPVLKTLDQALITESGGGRPLTYHAKRSAEFLELFDFPPQLVVIDKWVRRHMARESGVPTDPKWGDMEYKELVQFENVLKFWVKDTSSAQPSRDRLRLLAYTGEQEELRWLDDFWPI